MSKINFGENKWNPPRRRTTRRSVVPIILLIGVLAVARASHGQNFEQGSVPYQDYESGYVDHVNVDNGNLYARIPLVIYNQRGILKFSFSLVSNNKGWLINSQSLSWQPSSSLAGLILVNDQAFTGGVVGDCRKGYSLYLTAADNTSHPAGLTSGTLQTNCTQPPQTITLETADGSGVKVLAPSNGGLSTVIDPEGVRYQRAGDFEEDPNGNEILLSLTTSTYTDSLGRTIPEQPTSTTDYTGCTGSLPISSATQWTVPAPSGGADTFKFCYAVVTLQTNFGDPNVTEYSGTMSMLQSVALPNRTTWTFAYNSYGDLSQVTYPTGGTTAYTYVNINVSGGGGVTPERWVSSRTLNANDGTGGHVSNYNWGAFTSSPATVISTDPLGNDTVYTVTNLAGLIGSLWRTTESQTFQGSHTGGTLLKTVVTDWSVMTTTYSVQTAFPIRETTSWPNGQTKKVERDYDGAIQWTNGYSGNYGDLVQKREYDYGNGSSGALLRTTTTGYLAFTNSSYLNNNMLSLLSQVAVFGGAAGSGSCGSNGAISCTTFGYDEYSLQGSGVTTQHDPAPPTGTARGNQSSIHRWLNTTALTRTNTFFDTGELYTSTDPCGNTTCSDMTGSGHTTTFGYSSSFAGAYVTTATDALGHVTGYNYDFDTGLRTSTTDMNGQTTTYVYDSMWRKTGITYPLTPNAAYNGQSCSSTPGQTTYSYNDSPGLVSVTASKLLCGGASAAATTYMDGVGRTIRTIGENGAETDTGYDGAGRILTVTNPYFSTSDPTYGVTATTYDALDRVTQVTRQDQNTVSTSYSGNCATVTDEQQIARTTCSDGLDRIVSVSDASGQTTYAYDALGDLTDVFQAGQHRQLGYDSISRLTSATNPEWTPTGGSTPCSVAYSYDANGNIASRVAPKPNQFSCSTTVTTSFTYDVLNRLTQKSYTDGTPTAIYGYDQTSTTIGSYQFNVGYGIGRLSFGFTNPSIMDAYSYDPMGRIVDYYQRTQSTPSGSPWHAHYTYDLAGDQSSWTHPVGVTLTNTVNTAQQVTAVQESANDSTHPQYIATSIAYTPFGALSSLVNGCVSPCTAAQESYDYNKRLQPVRIQLGSSTSPGADYCMAYNYYSGLGNPGTCTGTPGTATTGNNGNVMGYWYQDGTPSPVPNHTVTYGYDNVNRLTSATAKDFSSNLLWSQSYGYDTWGNMSCSGSGLCTAVTYNSANNNQLASVAGSAVTYDAAGNQLTDPIWSPMANYTWDAEGRWVTITQGASTYSNTTFNAWGWAVEEEWPIYGNTVQDIIYDSVGNELGHVNVANGNWYDADFWTAGRMIAQYNSSKTEFLHANHLRTDTQLTDYSSTVTLDMLYYPWGQIWTHTGYMSDAHYAGMQQSAGNLYPTPAREYSNSLGRWLTTDPAGKRAVRLDDPQTWNMYAYVRNNPATLTDPSGLSWWGDFFHGLSYATWRPLVTMVQHPIITGKAIRMAITHPVGTFHAMRSGVVTTSQQVLRGNGTAIGTIVGTAGMFFIPGAGEAGDAAEAASDVSTIGEVAEAAGEAADAAEEGSGLLDKSLASEGQAAELAAGNGEPIAGTGTGTALRDADRLAAQYGGQPGDWVKVTSGHYSPAGTEGAQAGFETHAYQNVKTGQVVEMKTKLDSLPR